MFIFPPFCLCSLSRKAFLYFQVSYFKLAGSLGIVSLSASVLKGIDFVTLAMCAICSCLCGDRMAPNNLFPLSIGAWPVPVALAEFALQTCRGNARRHLRHNFSLTAQPLPPCRTLNYTVSILNAHMCACLGV